MSTLHGLFLLSHFDMQARPDRTERALRVFFPRQFDTYLTTLKRGEEVLVGKGACEALGKLASHLSAQGFKSSVRALEAES